MMYNLINELVNLVKLYEDSDKNRTEDIGSFCNWLEKHLESNPKPRSVEPEWAGKTNGRSADSVINTSLVHLYRYAKLHAKTAIAGTSFSTPDEFIYLISLASGGSMSKSTLIKQNVHEKPTGILIINRLIDKGLVEQQSIKEDKRSRIIHITPKGTQELTRCIERIRVASANVTEPLSHGEKMNLITLLTKLEDFHGIQNEGKF